MRLLRLGMTLRGNMVQRLRHSSVSKEVVRALGRLFGTHATPVVIFVLIVLLSVNWVSTGLMDGASALMGGTWQLGDLASAKALLTYLGAAVVVGTVFMVWDNNEPPDLHITEQKGLSRAHVLLLLLSEHKDPEAAIREMDDIGILCNDTDLGQHGQGLMNWRVLLEAIKIHLHPDPEDTVLSEVVVIPSRDEHGNGSATSWPELKPALTRMLKAHNVTVRGLDDLTKPELGCDFNRVESVWDAIDEVCEKLHGEGNLGRRSLFSRRPMVIDVTGGTKLASIAAAFFTRARDRQFQYMRNTPQGLVPLTINVFPEQTN